jgi:ASCH domain
MLGLTLWQPWASLIAAGIKRVENRSWSRDNIAGQRIAIHAGLAWDTSALDSFLHRPYPFADICAQARNVKGAIVCTVLVTGFVTKHDIRLPSTVPAEIAEWFSGPIGWVLDEVRSFAPIRCKGAQGLWRVPPGVHARILEAA